MPVDLRRAQALRRLAVLYARHLVRRTVRRPAEGDGLRAFDALYGPDRITALTPADREALPAQGRCIACGLCGMAAPRAGHLRPDRLPAQLTRSLPELWTSRDLRLEAVDWAGAAAVCPTGVPLAEMAGFVRDRLRRDGTRPPVPQHPPTELPVRPR